MGKPLGKLLVLLAVLLMPLGMSTAPAGPISHHAATMPMQHCPEQAPSHDPKRGLVECTMACSAALPAMDAALGEPHLTCAEAVTPAAQQFLHGLHPETATPPPRLS